MKRHIFTFCLALIFSILQAFAGTVEYTYTFNFSGVKQSGEYQQIMLQNCMLTAMPGQPAMPYHQVNLLLPPGEAAVSVNLEFSDEEVLPGTFKLFPQQPPRPVSGGLSGDFIKDEAVYKTNALFPVDPSGQLITSYLNGRAFALTSFTPARYNPVTGRFSYYRTVKVSIKTAGSETATAALNNLQPGNAMALKLADNKEMDMRYTSIRKPVTNGYNMLIITPSAFENNFGGLQQAYLTEGLTSQVVTRESIYASMTGLDQPEKIRNYIIQEYQNNGIEYVMLAGDDEQIPHRGLYCYVISGGGYEDQNIPADLYYSALDGNWNTDNDAQWGEPGEDDLLPDVAVARMSFSDAAELSRMINKTTKYQFSPVGGEFRNVLMAGEYLYSAPETWGSDYLELLKGEHSDNGYTTKGIPNDYSFDQLYEEDFYWSASDLMNHLNMGRPMLNHSGHANETYVMHLSNPDITDANFYALNGVDHNYTVVYTHGCLCGAFDYNDCIAEKMVGINNFAAAFVGNSRFGWFNEGQTEGPSAHLHREFMDALYSDSLNRIGRAHMESKIATASWVTAPGQWEPGALRWCFYDCNVLGDPAMAVFTDNPINISATYPASLVIGTPSMEVTVLSNSNPAKGLTCVATKNGQVIGQSVTDATGHAVITFTTSVTQPGDAQLTISGYNCKPTNYSFAFIPEAGAFVVYAGNSVNDDSGNLNGMADYGENLLLNLSMRNSGGANANNVMVTLSTTDPYISFTDSTELYALIENGDTLTIDNAFALNVADSVPDMHTVSFTVTAVGSTTWYSQFDMVCHAPNLKCGVLTVDDLAGGNGNGRLDAGETASITIGTSNIGSSNCSDVMATLSTLSPWVTITQPEVQLGNLVAGATANAVFQIVVNNNAPQAEIAMLDFNLQSGDYKCAGTYYQSIGLIVEDFETGNFSKFPWVIFGSNPWNISSAESFEGVYCATSASIGHGKQSEMTITLDVPAADSISFYSKVSSEEIFDNLKFYIDFLSQGEWSGEIPWQKHSFAVPAGMHTFKWVYSKDMGTSSGSDKAWVDFIVLPAFTDHTAINQPDNAGLNLVITPNPASEKVTVKALSDGAGQASIRIYNNTGKQVAYSGLVDATGGEVLYTFDISDFARGIYSCCISTEKKNICKVFVVN